jgi:hypothetical protein
MVRAVDPDLWGRGEQRTQARAFRERLLPYVWPRPRSLLWWEGISRAVHRLDAGDPRAAQVQELFGGLWHGFAKDLVDGAFVSEYNSLKHGLRAGFGSFYMLIGPEAVPGEPAPAEAMRSLGSSEHGSSFFTPRAFVEHPKEKTRRRGSGAAGTRTSGSGVRPSTGTRRVCARPSR